VRITMTATNARRPAARLRDGEIGSICVIRAVFTHFGGFCRLTAYSLTYPSFAREIEKYKVVFFIINGF
jgi:hypothetical protein